MSNVVDLDSKRGVIDIFHKARLEHEEERISDQRERWRLFGLIVAFMAWGALCFDIGLRVGQ